MRLHLVEAGAQYAHYADDEVNGEMRNLLSP